MQYNHFLIQLFFITFVLLGWTSCDSSNSPFPTDNIEPGTLGEVLYTKNITLEETIDAVFQKYGISDEMLGSYKPIVDMIKAFDIHYDASAITYRTTTPNGQSVFASGMVYFPRSRKPLGVIEISPINKEKGGCGTKEYKMAEILPGMLGYICLVPDLIGCGSTEELPIGYLQHQNAAVISADLRKAAQEFIAQHYQQELDEKSILFGYSLGGASIMSLARYYQQNPSRNVTVKHVFAGGGAYYPRTIVKKQFESFYSEYAIIPNILLSMDFYDSLKLDFSKIFKGQLLANYKSWCNGYMPVDKLTQQLGTDIRVYLTESFLNEYNTAQEYRLLMKSLDEKAIPEDWIPEATIHLFHAKGDNYVPIESGNRIYNYLKETGASIEYTTFEGSHLEGAVYMEFAFLKFLLNRHNL